tara:strand:+ start:547 stop:1017 length:471 start_codon:yes stop_codon:yes gene_type:complete
MSFVKCKHCKNIIIIFFLILLTNCSLEAPNKLHGINFLENRASILEVKKTNKNDVVKNMGRPHSTSINDDNTWIYFERMTSRRTAITKIGRDILLTNNILELKFDKYGVLEEKIFYNKEDIQKIVYSKDNTENTITQRSFVEKFLSSVKQKMYRRK